MKNYNVDILIIGSGPAGACAAFAASKEGLNILMVERKEIVGRPVRCAEYIPALLSKEIDIDNDFIVQSVKGMRTILPDGDIKETSAPGFMINRDKFDQTLSIKAEKAGTEIWLGSRAISLDGNAVLVRSRGKIYRINAGIIIGADGPHSRVGRWVHRPNSNLIPALQVSVPLVKGMDFTEVYFDSDFFGGYGWLFPKGKIGNVGIGRKESTQKKDSIKKSLDRFIARLRNENRIKGDISGCTAGWIPAEFPRKAVYGNILLAGDAAGQTHPISGAGVAQAVICGEMAGRWAARALKEKDMGLLPEYDSEWQDLYGESNKRAFKRRELMEKEWDHLDDIVRQCWIGFREYYEGTL